MFQRIIQFIKRDYLGEINYRLSFVLQFLGIFVHVAVWYYVSKLVGGAAWQGVGSDFFSFVLVGIAFSRSFDLALNAPSGKIGEDLGVIEIMFTSRTSPSQIVLMGPLWRVIFTILHTALYLLIGAWLFHANISHGNLIVVLFTFLLTLAALIGIGLFAASIFMIFKTSHYFTIFFIYLFQVFGGVYFPASILPQKIQFISNLLPTTYSLHILRGMLTKGLPWNAFINDFFALILFSIILVPLGLFSFEKTVKMAKASGTLAHR